MAVEKHLANKFLNGELTFAEYSEKWFGPVLVEDEEHVEVCNEFEEVSGVEEPPDESDGVVESENISGGSSRVLGEGNRRVKRRPKSHLPPALAGLMGEANLRYARGDHDTAEKICYEIIRQTPTAYEPFQTLAQIYESDAEKSLEFSLIAAHLNPDSKEWIRLAMILREKGDVKQELNCLTRAIQVDPKNISNHIRRLERLQYLEERNLTPPNYISIMTCRTSLMNSYPDSEGPTVLQMAKSIARDYHALNKIHLASNIMQKAYKRFSDLFTYEDLNLYLELLIAQKQYNTSLEVLVAKGDVEIVADLQTLSEDGCTQEVMNIISCNMPPSLPVDLRTKLIICLIHLKAFHLITTFVSMIIEKEDIETNGDVFLDIEEALTSENQHSEALKLLSVLVKSKNFSLPAVWLKYAECLALLDRDTEAIEAYQTVVMLAPQHMNARIKLSALLKRSNRIDEAYLALMHDESSDILDTGILYERCVILKNSGKKREYLNAGHLLLSRHFHVIRHRSEITSLIIKDTNDVLKAMREARGDVILETQTFENTCDKLTLEVEWEMLIDILVIAYDLKDYTTLQRISFLALASKRFSSYRRKLEFISLLASFYNSDSYHAFSLLKNFIITMPDKVGIWNLLNLILQRGEDPRSYKFLNRFLQKKESYDPHINILFGNYFLKSGTYRFAIKIYLDCYKFQPTALNTLLCGITMIQFASQKSAINRNTLIAQATAFFKTYENLRGEFARHEIYYNIGRAYHQHSLFNLACEYYKRALEETNELIESDPEIFNLQKEIAFNLHLIYRSNCPELARMYLMKYIVL